jgi:small nuclear ribonucleoprotein (snRNP)-like protein
MTSNIELPKTPIVLANNKTVIVRFSNGKEIIWGDMDSAEEAVNVAKELEVELRAVKYLQTMVRDFITEMREYLASLEIDDGLLDSILIDGHNFARMQINRETVNTIIMGAERGLRKEVLEHLASDPFIV